MQYGDNDTYGNPQPAIDALLRESERIGLHIDAEPLNAYDIGMTTTGPSVAALVGILRATKPITAEQRATLVTELIDFTNS